MQKALEAHLKTGSTTVCRTWSVHRNDGVHLGFTDHDCNLSFAGMDFFAATGLTAGVIEKATGLSIDNTEVLGAFSDDAINEIDILAGRYDGAEVIQYLVNWSNVEERTILFRGSIGEIVQGGGGFRMELLGLTDSLNQNRGRVYHANCSAALGDRHCQVNLNLPSLSVTYPLHKIVGGQTLTFEAIDGFPDGAFSDGKIAIQSGKGRGQVGKIKSDTTEKNERTIQLWQKFGQSPDTGDLLIITVGCDKRASTCRNRFDNFLNFRGFPHIPGEDWLRSSPDKRIRG